MTAASLDYLLRDHREAQQTIHELDVLLDELAGDGEWTRARCDRFQKISLYFAQGLCALIRKENEVLYPSLEAFLPGDFGPLAVLRGEHEALCANLAKLRESGRAMCEGKNLAQTLGEFLRFGHETADILRHHLYKEARVLFPMVARMLTPELDAEILRRMEALPPSPSKP